MAAEGDLDDFIDESIRRSAARGYHPTKFVEMRAKWGTQEAIKRVVVSGDLQSGLRRLHALGLLDWSIEAAALNFPEHFDQGIRAAAQFRLEQARRKS